jgi:ABC-type dipeptide/oligopeptide/nickel transport system ATPase component
VRTISFGVGKTTVSILCLVYLEENNVTDTLNRMPPKKPVELINFYEKVPKKFLDTAHNPNFDVHNLKIPFRMLIVGSSGSGKTNSVLNLLQIMANTFQTCTIITKNKNEPLYQWLETRIPQTHLTISEGIESIPPLDEYDKKKNHIVIFDDLLLDNLKQIGEYFIRCRKLNVSCIFLTQSYFSPDKNFKLMRRNCN